MSTFPSSVWDRLAGPARAVAAPAHAAPLSLAHYRRAIAHDREVLLNTRVAIGADAWLSFPACSNAILNFGVADVAQLCMTNGDDRKEICDRLTAAIERHEPRLVQVRAHLLGETGVVNRLSFATSALLREQGSDDRMTFDVTSEQPSLHYSIR